MHRSKSGHLRLADRPADYKILGIAPVKVAEFEDGQRIGTERGCYEWWYFDAHLDNGATIVVVFYTKPNVSPNSPLAPRITINITLPDGRIFDKLLDARPELFSASKSGCDVKIGTNRFVGDLHRYRITATIEEISVDIELTGKVRAWRPKSGHLYFGANGHEKLFAWLPSVPQGLASIPLQHWQRGTPRLRQRISRSQLGRRPHADPHPQLVLGAGQRRSLYDHRIPHHGCPGLWL
jgi:hypothetical protein